MKPSDGSMISGMSMMAHTQSTRGEIAMRLAKQLAMISAERATTRDWKEHPTFGIEVDTDRWAIEYQKTLSKLEVILKPHSTGGT